MPTEQPSSSSALKSITLRLHPQVGLEHSDKQQELVLSALAAALVAVDDRSSLAWTVQAIPGQSPFVYELMPLSEYSVSAKVAWEIAYALRAQPQIAMAEPLFDTIGHGEDSGQPSRSA